MDVSLPSSRFVMETNVQMTIVTKQLELLNMMLSIVMTRTLVPLILVIFILDVFTLLLILLILTTKIQTNVKSFFALSIEEFTEKISTVMTATIAQLILAINQLENVQTLKSTVMTTMHVLMTLAIQRVDV
jgi:hypothetical protein